MNDLRTHLADLAGPPAVPDAAQVEADLDRGRRALRRRRTTRTVAGAAFAVAVAAAAVSFGTGGDTPAGRPETVTTVTAARLVAYTGAQPKGFTVDKVPDGWFVQGDDRYGLTLAPNRVRDPGPSVDPSTDPMYDPSSFDKKIGILLESKDQHGPALPGERIRVGDGTGTLIKSPPAMIPGQPTADPAGDTGWQLFVRQPSGVYLIVQFAAGLGFGADQMAELAAGVHVHEGAVQGVG